MDSMRHLSKSLPYTQRGAQSQDLLVDFKAAALSVTNLYKSAAAAQSKARNAGYQDALDDLLAFLDQENLGLMDGEGWRVRQWATERLDDALPRPASSDDEEEGMRETTSETRSSTPETQRKPAPRQLASEVTEGMPTPRRGASEPPQPQAAPSTQTPLILSTTTYDVPTSDFTFRSNQAYPTQLDRDANPMEVDGSSETPRPLPRAKSRHNAYHRSRGEARSTSLQVGSGAGSKRKMTYTDFFDIAGFNFDIPEKKDTTPRGTKKGRFT